MSPVDEEKTTFMTGWANFCYTMIPFGLKNSGATYQRLMDIIFQEVIAQAIGCDIKYEPRGPIKTQALADFVAELVDNNTNK